MSEKLRSREEIEAALKEAEHAFEGFSRVANCMAKSSDENPDYYRAIEDRAVGHGAIVHILQWILGHHDDSGIDRVSITELRPGVSIVRVFHSSGMSCGLCDLTN